MDKVTVPTKLSKEERETILLYDPINDNWNMVSTVSKHFNKAVRQGWKKIKEYVYKDGLVCGMELDAPGYAITIRNTEKKKMTDKQMQNLPNEEEKDEE